MPLNQQLLSPRIKWVIFALFGYFCLLTFIAATLPEERFRPLFSETGFFEQFSIVSWILAAIILLVWVKPRSKQNFAIAFLFLLCAAREADWHKKFTSDGILKINYYTKSAASLGEKMAAALASAVFIGLILYALYRGFMFLRSPQNRRRESVLLTALAVFLFFAGKILDRSVSILHKNFDITVPSSVGHFIGAYEEGFEMITPLLFALAFVWRDRLTSDDALALKK